MLLLDYIKVSRYRSADCTKLQYTCVRGRSCPLFSFVSHWVLPVFQLFRAKFDSRREGSIFFFINRFYLFFILFFDSLFKIGSIFCSLAIFESCKEIVYYIDLIFIFIFFFLILYFFPRNLIRRTEIGEKLTDNFSFFFRFSF